MNWHSLKNTAARWGFVLMLGSISGLYACNKANETNERDGDRQSEGSGRGTDTSTTVMAPDTTGEMDYDTSKTRDIGMTPEQGMQPNSQELPNGNTGKNGTNNAAVRRNRPVE